MKISKVIIGAATILLMSAYAFSAELGWMRISLIEGDVSIKTAGMDDWGAGALNGPLAEGDQVWAPEDSRVELQMPSRSYLRLDGLSAVQILSLDKENSQFYLSQGQGYFYFHLQPGGTLQVDTPDVSIRAFNDTVFRIDVSVSDHYTDVAVYKGHVEAENRLGRTRINAGEMLSLAQDTEGEVSPMGPPDQWESWNKERNDRLFAREDPGARYLPPELRAYAYDFTAGGRWVQVPGYGYCWTPLAGINADWAPYRRGRWAWIGGDYVWISADPWGWVPYHYGRWAFFAAIGWCWVPPLAGDVYWGPGFVGWVKTNDYVAWVPLAPGEIYYGRGYFGRNSVNVTTININQVRITQVFKNVTVPNAAIVVRRDSFATGSPQAIKPERGIRQRLFTRENISVGVPDIRPAREGHFMSPRNIPPTKRPPQPVRNVEIRRLKELRPLVREPDKSVLNRSEHPGQLPLRRATTPRPPGGRGPALRPTMPVPGKPMSPAPQEEKRSTKPQEGRLVPPQGPPAREERGEMNAPGRRPNAPTLLPIRPPAGEEHREMKAPERREVAPSSPPPREAVPTGRPPERRPETPVLPAPQGERRGVEPREQRSVTPAGPTVRPPTGSEHREMRAPERREVAPPSLPPREAPRSKQPERGPVTPEATAPKKERPQDKKPVGAEKSSPGNKKENNPDKDTPHDKGNGEPEEEQRRR